MSIYEKRRVCRSGFFIDCLGIVREIQVKQEYRKNPRRLNLTPDKELTETQLMPYIPSAMFDRGLNGYLNYCRYRVTGHDGSGMRTLSIDAATEDTAAAMALSSGLSSPLTIVPCPHKTPGALQLEYARDLGITLPEDVCAEDAACLIARAVEDDTSVPSKGIAQYADRHGVRFSAWIGMCAFLNLLWRSLSMHDRLYLFVYSVSCYLDSRPLEDPDDHDPAGYARFADEFIDNAEVVRNLERSEGESLLGFDAYTAKTYTAAFTAAVGFLRGYKLS